MKRKLKFLLVPILALIIMMAPDHADAQKYRIAAGWRAGGTNGITMKLVPVKGLAIEGIYGIYPYGQSLTGMIESHRPILCIQALQLYTGIGGHYRFNYMSGRFSDPINGTFEVDAPPGTRGWGLDAVAGIELKLPILPIAISAEVKPMIEWTNAGAYFWGIDPGLGLKVAF